MQKHKLLNFSDHNNNKVVMTDVLQLFCNCHVYSFADCGNENWFRDYYRHNRTAQNTIQSKHYPKQTVPIEEF